MIGILVLVMLLTVAVFFVTAAGKPLNRTGVLHGRCGFFALILSGFLLTGVMPLSKDGMAWHIGIPALLYLWFLLWVMVYAIFTICCDFAFWYERTSCGYGNRIWWEVRKDLLIIALYAVVPLLIFCGTAFCLCVVSGIITYFVVTIGNVCLPIFVRHKFRWL